MLSLPNAPRKLNFAKVGLEEIEKNIREAIELHLEGMAEDGEVVPEPSTTVQYVEMRVA